MAKTWVHSQTAGSAGPRSRRSTENRNGGRHGERVDPVGAADTTRIVDPLLRKSSPRAGKPSDDRQTLRAVVGATAGDREAIRYLYCRYADNVHGYVRGIVRDHQEAEDLTRDIFSELKGSIADYSPRGELPFSVWIFTVARDAALAHLRRQRSVPVARGIRQPGSAPCLAFTRTVGHSPADHSG